MHKGKRAQRITGRGGNDKTAVMGILERTKDGKPSTVRTSVVANRKKKTLQAEVREHVEAGSALYTDFLLSYEGLDSNYAHQVVDHTNGLENFWSLLKRGIKGTYVSVEPFHLFRYLDEQVYRYNNRKHMNDFDRFKAAMSGIVGKRLTWKQATGKDDDSRLTAN